MNKGVFSSKNVQCEVKTVSTFAIYCPSLESKLVLSSCMISTNTTVNGPEYKEYYSCIL